MIAGTFTPIALLALNEVSATKLLWTIWIVTLVGIVQSIFFVHLPKMVSSCLYLVAGYLVLPYIGEIKNSIGPTNAVLIIAGGLTYSLGALSYGLKRPVLNPQIFGYHEVFHVLVSIAAILHFIVIDSLV
jgi:hemolysin III